MRSGRKTSSSLRTPTRIAAAIVMASAGAANAGPRSPVRSAQKPYAATIETAPVDRLMIPAPR